MIGSPRTLAGILLALLLAVGFALPAAAQDGPHEGILVVDPPSVPEAGEYTVTITGSDWLPDTAMLLSTCVAPIDEPLVPGVSGPEEIGAAIEAWAADPFTYCKVTEAVTVSVDSDGAFVQELDIEVVDNFFISAVAAELDDSQQGTMWYQIIPEGDAAEAPEGDTTEALAVTGAETTTLALFGLAFLFVGALLISGARRLTV